MDEVPRRMPEVGGPRYALTALLAVTGTLIAVGDFDLEEAQQMLGEATASMNQPPTVQEAMMPDEAAINRLVDAVLPEIMGMTSGDVTLALFGIVASLIQRAPAELQADMLADAHEALDTVVGEIKRDPRRGLT